VLSFRTDTVRDDYSRGAHLKPIALTLIAACLALAACGEGSDDDAAAGTSAASPSTTRTSTPAPSTSATPATSSSSAPVPVSPEIEQQVVTTATAGVFAENGDLLSDQLVKSSSLVEAQTDFRFDEASRTVVVGVTSVFETGSPSLPYSLAGNFAPVLWGPEATASVRAESLPFFSVTVDGTPYVCAGPTMVALADRELSEEMFVEQCTA
jgi:hypothetical protein